MWKTGKTMKQTETGIETNNEYLMCVGPCIIVITEE